MVGLDGVRSIEQVTDAIRYDLASFFLPMNCGFYLVGCGACLRYVIDRHGHGENLAKRAARDNAQAGPGVEAELPVST